MSIKRTEGRITSDKVVRSLKATMDAVGFDSRSLTFGGDNSLSSALITPLSEATLDSIDEITGGDVLTRDETLEAFRGVLGFLASQDLVSSQSHLGLKHE